jgi:hypothetical protein
MLMALRARMDADRHNNRLCGSRFTLAHHRFLRFGAGTRAGGLRPKSFTASRKRYGGSPGNVMISTPSANSA